MKRKASYFEKLKDPMWQKKRLEILQRDEFKCRDCGAADKELHVHHCHYEKGKEPWEAVSALLLTLCKDCHESRQELESELKSLFGKIFSKTSVEFLLRLRDNAAVLLHRKLEINPVLTDIYQLDFETSSVWFEYCLNNPSATAREMYEHVTRRLHGTEVRWQK